MPSLTQRADFLDANFALSNLISDGCIIFGENTDNFLYMVRDYELEIQEKRALLEDCVVSSQKLLDSLKDSDSLVSMHIKDRIEKIKLELKDLPIISNEQLTNLFNPITSSRELQQFLYFKSLSYINKLREPKYKELIDICFIDDDTTRATEFNKWCQNDKNMNLLNSVFPIIFSTTLIASPFNIVPISSSEKSYSSFHKDSPAITFPN